VADILRSKRCAWMYEVTVVAGGRYLRKRCRIEK
jgi:hypothetical protein